MGHTLKFYIKVFLSGRQGAVRLAVLYVDRSCGFCYVVAFISSRNVFDLVQLFVFLLLGVYFKIKRSCS